MKKIVVFALSCLLPLSALALNSNEEINKNNVLSFYELAINDKDFESAKPYLGDHYIQHNPTAEDGIVGFEKFISYLKQNFPQAHSEIKRTFVEGDYVILQVHSIKVPGSKGEAIVDVFRLENNKIVEHWDVHQSVPEKSANDNGMF